MLPEMWFAKIASYFVIVMGVMGIVMNLIALFRQFSDFKLFCR
jgi:hypothetical protein